MTIGIIEDDVLIRTEISKLLNQNGYQTVLFLHFKNLLEDMCNSSCDLFLMDVNLPYCNGYDICQQFVKKSKVPVLFVTSRSTDIDELLSIESGGIDFIVKPYHKTVLLEKVKRALKVCDPNTFKTITKKGCTLDLHMSTLEYLGNSVELTRNEFRILYYFFTSCERIISKEELLDYLWNDKYYLDENILMVNINRLRKKALEIGIQDLLKTIRGKGYTL